MDPKYSKHCINYEVVFAEQGIQLTHAEVEETKISISRALQVLAKYVILKSITKSQRIIGAKRLNHITGSVYLPEIQ
jgi:hypothetical protein